MVNENAVGSAAPGGMSFFRKGLIAAVALLLAFLTGFVPSYAKAKSLEDELRAARAENSLGQLRDLASLTYTQAAQNDYGVAAGTSTRFFNRTRELVSLAANPAQRQALEDLMSLRDPVTAKLAVADPSVVKDLQGLLLKTRDATSSPPMAATR